MTLVLKMRAVGQITTVLATMDTSETVLKRLIPWKITYKSQLN